MPKIPEFMLRALYVQGSLRREGDGFTFQMMNGVGPAGLSAPGRCSLTASRSLWRSATLSTVTASQFQRGHGRAIGPDAQGRSRYCASQ